MEAYFDDVTESGVIGVRDYCPFGLVYGGMRGRIVLATSINTMGRKCKMN